MSEEFDMSDEMREQLEGLPVMSEEEGIMSLLREDVPDRDDLSDDMREQLEGLPVLSQ